MKRGFIITATKINWHLSFFLYLVIAFFGGLIKEVLIILVLLFAHELGHLFFLRLFKYPVNQIDIYPFGAIISFDETHNDFVYKKILIASGGIIVNILLCLILFPFKNWFTINLLLMIINLMPLFPLDGGRIFGSIMELIFPYRYARKSLFLWGFLLSFAAIIAFILYYRRIYLLLLVMILFKLNYEKYQLLADDWIVFTTNKYLYPNKKLPIKKIKYWLKHPINALFSGKNNVYQFGECEIKEEVILKDVLENQ